MTASTGPDPEPALPSSSGRVALVGAGPGDPGLLTRRGAELLAAADVIVYDHLVESRLVALAPPSALRLFAGKERGRCPVPQEEINRLLVEHARAGRRVVRLKGGDPYVFGRGAEEAEFLREHGVVFEVVPGVTAGVGVTSYAGIPVTHRADASAVAFVTGHDDPDSPDPRLDWPALARFPGTLVFYMGYRHHRAIARRLAAEGMRPDTAAALVQSGTTARQRVVTGTLANLAERVEAAGLSSPALLVVGAVVERRAELAWFEELPLFGRRIVVTRPLDEAERAARDLEALGAEVMIAPTVTIRPVADPGPMDEAIERLDVFQWLVFTSPNGVRHFLDRLAALGRDLRVLGHIKLAAIGPATAEALAAVRLKADLVPESYRSEGLVQALTPLVGDQWVLLARADRGRELLKDELGPIARVEQVAAYSNADAESIPADVAERLAEGSVDWVTLTSSAIARRFHALCPESARREIAEGRIRLATISPVTSETVRELGWPVAAEATEHTWPGVVRAIVEAETAG